ncbi:phage tail protein [Sphingopyxis sp. GW247-27LB]|uniref:phage tail protein n=1 Tax=Sphingopyxis sp. GW247-27LB TaxID=2012632 RepID=UPI00159638B0|nr:phage tail protein [Sphingopyxis sp. GW247-27LB]
MHVGLCTSGAKVTRIFCGEKVAWTGNVSTLTAIDINRANLFGGPKKEGGLVGTVYFLPGAADQLLPETLARRMGLAANDCPAYRGLTTMFFIGNGASGGQSYLSNVSSGGFLWSSNSPFIQDIWVELDRTPEGLDPDIARIGNDANPAHIIYEAMTNSDWGMGGSSLFFNTANWNAVAQTLYDETFGLSLRWTQQAEIENFINEVLGHIAGSVYVDPRDGLFNIMLYRDDYDYETLPVVDVSNARLVNFERKMWGEVTNEISATWTNPENGKEESVTAQDLASIAIHGAPISDSRDYFGVRNPDLAMRLALRDLRIAATPLAIGEIECDRSFFDKVPGGVLRLLWNDPSIDLELDMAIRIIQIDRGRKTNAKIKISFVEDVFGLSKFSSTGSQGSEATPPEEPLPLSNEKIISLPAFFALGSIDRTTINELAYPETFAGVLGASDQADAQSFDIFEERPNAAGVLNWTNIGTKSLVGVTETDGALAAEAETPMSGSPFVGVSRGPQIGGFVIFGDTTDDEMEIALVKDYDSVNDEWILARGVLDTIPREWPTATVVRFMPAGFNVTDDTLRSGGEDVDLRMLTRTSLGTLDIDDATTVTATLVPRVHGPLRPANVKINDQGFGIIDATAATDLVVTWSNRSRFYEDGIALAWDAASVPPEYLQEILITVFRENGDEMFVVRGLWEETTYTIPMAWVEEETRVFVRLHCILKGVSSLQAFGLFVDLPVVGSPGPPPAAPVVIGPPPDPPEEPEEPTPGDPGGGTIEPPTIEPGQGGGFCVTDDTPILLANDLLDGPGVEISASDVTSDHWVWTRDEISGEWGAFKILNVAFAFEPVFHCMRDGWREPIRATARHRFEDGSAKWIRAEQFGEPAGIARVAKISTAARTYISAGVLSHNIKIT